MRSVILATTLAFAGSIVLAGCSPTGPSSQTEVCTTFDELGEKLLGANGVFDNALFHKAGDLADVAERYPGNPSLATDSAALAKISDSESTSGSALTVATATIANLCGHPLGLGGLFSGNGRTGQ